MLIPKICFYCKRWENSINCEAFPKGIPAELNWGFDHRKKFGNEKLLFEPIEMDTEQKKFFNSLIFVDKKTAKKLKQNYIGKKAISGKYK